MVDSWQIWSRSSSSTKVFEANAVSLKNRQPASNFCKVRNKQVRLGRLEKISDSFKSQVTSLSNKHQELSGYHDLT
jgi:hypothetical protein